MQALEGCLVVAIEQAVAAPFCTSRLAAAGARVIKIERTEGDFARNYDTAAHGESSYFTWLNQGKESVCLNFKDERDATVLHAIIRKADVLIQNLAPGALDRAGFSSKKLMKDNPGLIICNVSGYGQTGEATKKRAYDLLVQAESGLISVSGSPEAPGRIGVSICDIGAGMTAYGGVLEALLRRGKTGKGEEISVSLFDVAADWMNVPYIHAEYGNGAPSPVGLRHPSIAPYGAFECADGGLTLISIQNEREWQRLCDDVLCSPALAQNEGYESNNARVANRDALEADITKITKSLTSQEFQSRMDSAQIAYGAVNRAGDLKSHPAFRTQQYRTGEEKSVSLAAHPINKHQNMTPPTIRSPKLGEHTEAVIREFSRSEN